MLNKANWSQKGIAMLNKITWTWKDIAALGSNKLVQRSYFFFFFVPILAKILSEVKSPIEMVIGQHKFKFLFALPFNWQIFFFSAVCFAIASLLYELIAPKIIKDNKSMGEFFENRKGMRHIMSYMENLYISDAWIESKGLNQAEARRGVEFSNPTDNERKMLDVYRTVMGNLLSYNILFSQRMNAVHGAPIFRRVGAPPISGFVVEGPEPEPRHHLESEAEYISMSFWTVFDYANTSKKNVRLLISIFYISGFISLLWMFVENILTVWPLS